MDESIEQTADGSDDAAAAGTGTSWKVLVPAMVAALLIGAAATFFAIRPAPEAAQAARFDIPLPPDTTFSRTGRQVLAISRDGSKIVFNADGQLWLRELDRGEPEPLRNTTDARAPFFSPDGNQLGFEAGGVIQRVALSGGAPIDVVEELSINGASWADNGTIYYGGRGGIFAVAAAGGTPAELIVPIEAGEGAYGPRLLPGGE